MILKCLPRYGRLGASSRLRTHQFLDYFRGSGFETHVSPLISDLSLAARYQSGRYSPRATVRAFTNRMSALAGIRSVDLTWIEKELFPWLPGRVEERLLINRPYVLDIDDAVFHRYDTHRNRLVRRWYGQKIDQLMAGARLVVAGSSYLAVRAQLAGARRVETIPTVVDVSRYSTRVHVSDARPVRIVWIGSPSTAQYLSIVGTAIKELARRCPIMFRVIGAVPPPMADVPTEIYRWAEKTEAKLLASCDVGIMPLPDSPWERGKCGYKLIQYMASGLPTVASPIGANTEIVRDGETGWLAATPEEWLDRLMRLASDHEERSRLGRAGRIRVERQYCTAIAAPRLVGLLHEVASASA